MKIKRIVQSTSYLNINMAINKTNMNLVLKIICKKTLFLNQKPFSVVILKNKQRYPSNYILPGNRKVIYLHHQHYHLYLTGHLSN